MNIDLDYLLFIVLEVRTLAALENLWFAVALLPEAYDFYSLSFLELLIVFLALFFVIFDLALLALEMVDFFPLVERENIVEDFYSSSASSSSSSSSSSISISKRVSAAIFKFSTTSYFSFPFLSNHSENSIKTSTISTDPSFL